MGQIKDGTPIACVACGRKTRFPVPEGWRREWQQDGSGFNCFFCPDCPGATVTVSWAAFEEVKE